MKTLTQTRMRWAQTGTAQTYEHCIAAADINRNGSAICGKKAFQWREPAEHTNGPCPACAAQVAMRRITVN